jgi:hypothetical protein
LENLSKFSAAIFLARQASFDKTRPESQRTLERANPRVYSGTRLSDFIEDEIALNGVSLLTMPRP